MLAMATQNGHSKTVLSWPKQVSKPVTAVRFRCEECDWLWAEYTKSTFQHIHVENNLKLAALEGDVEAVERLTLATEEALRQREYIREAIHKHEASQPSHRQPSSSSNDI
jgi:hypothetical protein